MVVDVGVQNATARTDRGAGIKREARRAEGLAGHHPVDEWTVASELLRLVNEEGNKRTAALPLHVTVANLVLQLLHIIRGEYLLAVNKSTQAVQRFVESYMNHDEKSSRPSATT